MFKQIPQHPQYSVDEYGIVMRDQGGRIPLRKPYLHKSKGKETGYMYVTMMTRQHITQTGEVIIDYPCFKPVAVHRLVMFAHVGPPPDGKPWVNHKDGNKLNNHVTNLEWTSISENIQHKFDSGLYKTPTGADHWKYGKSPSKETRLKMGAKKRGENHPKFKGWWVVNGKKYASTIEAAEDLGTYPKKIAHMCKKKNDLCYFLPK